MGFVYESNRYQDFNEDQKSFGLWDEKSKSLIEALLSSFPLHRFKFRAFLSPSLALIPLNSSILVVEEGTCSSDNEFVDEGIV